MALFSRRDNSSGVDIIFDVGSSSVGGAIVRYDKDQLPEILFSVRKDIPFKHEFDFDHFYDSMLRSLESVTVDVLSSLSNSVEDVAVSLDESGERILGRRGVSKRVRNVYCVFSSPWYLPKIVDFREEFKSDTLITSEVVLGFVKDAVRNLKGDYSSHDSVGVLEQRVLEYRLNGYRIDDPIHSSARTVDLKLYLSAVSKRTVAAVKKPIRSLLSFRKIRSFSFLMVFFSVVRDMHPSKKNFATFDFRGEVSEFAVVENDTLTTSITIPYGTHTLVRAVAKTLNLELFEASSKLSLFFSGKLAEETQAKIQVALESEMIAVKNALFEKLERGVYLPHAVFVISNREQEEIATKVIESTYNTLSRELVVTTLSDEYFNKYATFTKSRYEDHFLSLAALFFRIPR